MNTTGFIRGYLAKNMPPHEFIKVVVKALSREFEVEVKLEESDGIYLIEMDENSVSMGKGLVEDFQSPYGLDKYVLEELEKQGFHLDRNRSQYIQYCFGNYGG